MTLAPALLALSLLVPTPASAVPPDPSIPEQALARVFDNAPFRARRAEPAAAEVELGRALFFDPRLSSDGTISCSRCHSPAMGWRDGLSRAKGLGQKTLRRRAPSLLNAARTDLFFWDGRAASFSEAALAAIANPEEMNMPVPSALKTLESIPGYPALFAKAYGDRAATSARVGSALEAFVLAATRQPPSPFDRYAAGDKTALSAEAQRGLVLFTGKARCQRCHLGAAFSDGFFHNTGVKPSADGDDPGRYAVTPVKRAFRAFKTVPLRGVELTAPYMHNGSLKSLEEVVDFYNRGGDEAEERDMEMKALELTDREKSDLVAFLRSLTSPPAPVAFPVLPGTASAEAPAAEAASGPADPLERAEASAAAAEKTLAGASARRRAASCRAEWTLDKAVAGYNEGKVPSGVAADTDRGQGTLEDILFERIYRVALTGDMKLCDPLKMPVIYAGIMNPGSFWCRDLYLDAAAALMLATRSPAFDGVCRQWVSVSYPKIPAAEAGEACAVIRRDVGEPEKLCSAMIPRWLDEESRPGCLAEYRRYAHPEDPAVCDYVKGAPDSLHLRCDDYARLARATKAKDPSLCGDSEVCRLLTGRGADLPAKYEEHARAAWCEAALKDAEEADRTVEAAAEAGIDSGESALARAEESRASVDRPRAARIDAAAERLARLRRRLTAGVAQAAPPVPATRY